jgi:hypothetical protein
MHEGCYAARYAVEVYKPCQIVPALWIGVSLCASPAYAEDSMRCGSRLVSVKDGKDKVRTLCGEPTSVDFQGVIRRAPRYEYGYGFSRYEYYGPGVVEMPVEIWTYNFGSSKLLRKLRFVGDELDEIRTEGYGY